MQIFLVGMLAGMALDMLVSVCYSSKDSYQGKSREDFSWIIKEAIDLREECNQLKIENIELKCKLDKITKTANKN